mmetsp:Transcript_23683/g.66519  ORF Transcript_23683/g.66519 Transcript_23683/m.66519 type:complete len:221 (+) Transcript_23683:1068-1730(+)
MSQPTSTTVAVTMSPTRHASKIGIPRAFLLVSVDSDPVDSSSSASSAAYNSSSSASSNVSKDDATVTPSTDSRRVSSDGVRLETPLESLSSYSDGVDLDSGTPASRASAIPLCSRTPGSLSSSLLGSGGVAGGVWWRSLSGGTFALGLGLGFGAGAGAGAGTSSDFFAGRGDGFFCATREKNAAWPKSSSDSASEEGGDGSAAGAASSTTGSTTFFFRFA